jgi:hypothetical protein
VRRRRARAVRDPQRVLSRITLLVRLPLKISSLAVVFPIQLCCALVTAQYTLTVDPFMVNTGAVDAWKSRTSSQGGPPPRSPPDPWTLSHPDQGGVLCRVECPNNEVVGVAVRAIVGSERRIW